MAPTITVCADNHQSANTSDRIRSRAALALLLAGLFLAVGSRTGSADDLGPISTNDDPVLSTFNGSPIFGTFWLFSGTVSDEAPGSCNVEFGDLLNGHSTGVDSSGSFSYLQNMGAQTGFVSAIAVDPHNAESNEEEVNVD